jgi:NAD-dependent aldehyde dehydrogenases
MTFLLINPSTEEAFAIISLGSAEDVDKAINAAKIAFETWRETTKEERLALLEKFDEIYNRRWDEMVEAQSKEMGAPLDFASETHTKMGADICRNNIEILKDFNFEHQFDPKSNNHIRYEPIGVCGLITPWNFPMNQIVLKVIPALAAGCTMILKPSEIAPVSAVLFAEMIDEAGFPAGVFNLVNGNGEVVGNHISGHPDIDMVSFTGSTRAGKLIQKNAADTIKKVTLELGGKGGNIGFCGILIPMLLGDGVRNIMKQLRTIMLMLQQGMLVEKTNL